MRPERCPNCGKPAAPDHAPFCSVRCQQVDLGRWLNGTYAAPALEEDDWDGEAESDDRTA